MDFSYGSLADQFNSAAFADVTVDGDLLDPHSSLGYRPPAPCWLPGSAFRLPRAAAMQQPLNWLGPENAGQVSADYAPQEIFEIASKRYKKGRSARPTGGTRSPAASDPRGKRRLHPRTTHVVTPMTLHVPHAHRAGWPPIGFSELLFTVPGLFMLPSALPPPAAI